MRPLDALRDLAVEVVAQVRPRQRPDVRRLVARVAHAEGAHALDEQPLESRHERRHDDEALRGDAATVPS